MNSRRPLYLFIVMAIAGAGLAVTGRWGRQASAQMVQPNGITAPAGGEVVAGIVTVAGTAAHPDFLRYELSFYKEFDPYAGWIVFAEGGRPVISDTLAVWDTTVGRAAGASVFPDGRYRLRLRVVRRDYNYDEFFVTDITLSNDAPTPTPTITATATVDPNGTATPVGVEGALLPEAAAMTPLPTLTPFPTLPAPPTVAVQAAQSGGSGRPEAPADPVRDFVEQVQNVDTTPFLAAAWQGVRVTLWSFAALAAYLTLRTIARWVWVRRKRFRVKSHES